jgi:hypothetical protein
LLELDGIITNVGHFEDESGIVGDEDVGLSVLLMRQSRCVVDKRSDWSIPPTLPKQAFIPSSYVDKRECAFCVLKTQATKKVFKLLARR